MNTRTKKVAGIAVVTLAATLIAGSVVAQSIAGTQSTSTGLGIGFNILGVWSCNQNLYADPAHPTVVTDKDYFIETFHPDLTDFFQNSALDGQSLSFAPQGVYATTLQGKWFVSGSNTVSRVSTFILNTKSASIPGVPPYIAGQKIPVSRALVTCQCNLTGPDSMVVKGKVQYYPIDDIGFNSTTRVLPDLPFDAVCSRLKFTSGN